jgi:hypothetical protein
VALLILGLVLLFVVLGTGLTGPILK